MFPAAFFPRPTQLLPVCLNFPYTFDRALLCVSPWGSPPSGLGGSCLVLIHPSAGPGQGGLALYTTPRAALLAWSWGPRRGLQLSVNLLLLVFCTALEFVLASGSLSPQTAPRLPQATSGMFWEGSRRRWSAGRTRCAGGDDPPRRLGLLQPSQQLSIKTHLY